MGGLLSSLNTPYTGLTGHQVMVDVTGNNIANASNEFYSRQVVRSAAETPLWKQNYALGQGLDILTIERVHDEYTFMRYKKASMEETYAYNSYSGLREASSYYPEIDSVGIYNDLQEYFNAWKDISTKAGDPAQKIALAERAGTLAKNIQETRNSLEYLQQRLNDEMKVAVEEVNRLGQQIAQLNKKIKEYENQDLNKKANDLRDLRDQYEFEINNLMGCDVFKKDVKGSACVNKDIADFDEDYTLTIGGRSIVDGDSFHPLVLDNSENPSGIYTIKYVRGDHKPYNLTNAITEGKVGALLDLIRTEDVIDCSGTIGKLQVYINDLDSFANGIIEATNNIYAESSQRNARSDVLTLSAQDALTTSGYNIHSGTFKVVMYDKAGNELGAREVKINNLTNMISITDQLNANVDDNTDGNALNDFDDYFVAVYNNDTKTFSIEPKPGTESQDIYISIQDNGTNFAGAFGVNRFFDGYGANDIELAYQYRDDPTLIRAFREAVDGNFEVANKMQQLQFDKIVFTDYKGEERTETISGYFRYIAGKVASETQAAEATLETKEAVLQSTKKEYTTISEVSIDDELVNLIRFQSGYSANAKMVTAIDEMLTTLLGIKQ